MTTAVESAGSDLLSAVEKIPGLEILELIGQGAFSYVFRARRGTELVALKIQKEPTLASDMRRRAWREAATLARLRHPSLCAVHTVDELGNRIYIVMEYVDGETLAAHLARRPLVEAEVRRIGVALADALGVVHRGGLVHGDIKPGNILVDGQGRPKVIDFGLSVRSQGREDAEGAFGTLTHASPEQLRVLKRPVDARSDLYSLGVLLYEMAVGHLPFQSDVPDDLLRMHATMTPTAPHHLRAAVSESLSNVIMRLLAKDPDDRYQSSSELALDLAPDGAMSSGPWPLGARKPHHGRTGSGDLPLAGRRSQVHRLLAAWETVREGRGATVLVRGPAGSGKSRLARELVRRAEAEGACVLTAKCTAQDPLPFSAVRQLLNDLLAQVQVEGSDSSEGSLRARVIDAVGLGGVYLRRMLPGITRIVPGIPSELDQIQTPEQMNASLVQLFTGLAMHPCGLALVFDDVQWLDEATLGLVARLDAEIPKRRLLLLSTARTGADCEAGIRRFRGSVPTSLAIETEINALDSDAIESLIKSYLHTDAVTDDIVERLRIRSDGNALAVLEYLQALIDTGCVRYTWGRWVFSDAGLDQVALPSHIVSVMTERLAGLGADVQSALVAGAMLGSRFDLETLRAVLGSSGLDLDQVLQAALSGGVLERMSGTRYAFVHDRLREVVLSTINDTERLAMHRRIALCLDDDSGTPQNEERVYAVAHHYAMASSPELAARGFVANWKGAKAAHKGYAFEQAYAFFVSAESMAKLGDVHDLPAQYSLDRGFLCVASWRNEEAARCFERVLETTQDVDLRARACMELAKLRIQDSDVSKKYAADALEALGEAYIEPTVWRVMKTLVVWLGRSIFPMSPIDRSDGRAVARTEMIVECYEHAGFIEFYQQRTLGMIQAPFVSQTFVRRLGLSVAQVGLFGATAAIASVFRLNHLAHALLRRARQAAAALGDPATLGRANLFAGYVLEYEGKPALAADTHQETLEVYRKWMEAYYVGSCLGTLVPNLTMRGLFRDVRSLIERALREQNTQHQDESQRMLRPEARRSDLLFEAMMLAAETALSLQSHRVMHQLETEWRLDAKPSRFFRPLFLGFLAIHLLYADEDLSQIDELKDQFLAEKPNLRGVHQLHVFTVAEAWIRLRQMELATSSDEKSYAREQYRSALKRLERGARHPTIRAHAAASEAKRLYLEGSSRRCLRRLAEAQDLAEAHDNAWVLFEVGLIRSKIRNVLGPPTAARRLEATVRDFAISQSVAAWKSRSGAPLGGASVAASRSVESVGRTASVVSATSLQTSRSLSALLQVSLASTMILDPERQARVVLDKIVQLLGAERALLFLVEQEDGIEVTFAAGRTNEGADVVVGSAYSRSVVGDVVRTRRAVVIGGIERGDQEVSESVVIHDLRSIVAAPLLLRERLMGVVYADNTLARGMFTEDDVEVFSAIANHVAIAFETSRTARLEADFEAERAQRKLAEHLRAVISSLGSSLELHQVLESILDNMTHVVSYRRAVLLLTRESGLVVAAHRGFAGTAVDSERVVPFEAFEESGDLEQNHKPSILRRRFPYPYPGVVDAGDVVLSIPLVVRDEVLGLLTIQIEDPGEVDGLGDADDGSDVGHGSSAGHGSRSGHNPGAGASRISMATMFAGHAAIAVENARLFEEVRAQATTDSLTGLFTRRHFFLLADREFARARRESRCISVAMLDVDHFKRVNDTYGHAVGDQVLVETARRLQRGIRETDILGRFGGEEFCVVLVDSGASREGEGERPDFVVAERLRRLVADTPFETSGGVIPVTISLGLAANVGDRRGHLESIDHVDARSLLERADEALYRAKKSGRNRVEVYSAD